MTWVFWKINYYYLASFRSAVCSVSYIYIHTYIYLLCIYIYVHTYIHTYHTIPLHCIALHYITLQYIHTDRHTHRYIHTQIHTYTDTYIHRYIRRYIHRYMHACMHPSYIHTYNTIPYHTRQTYIHTYAYIYTYILWIQSQILGDPVYPTTSPACFVLDACVRSLPPLLVEMRSGQFGRRRMECMWSHDNWTFHTGLKSKLLNKKLRQWLSISCLCCISIATQPT